MYLSFIQPDQCCTVAFVSLIILYSYIYDGGLMNSFLPIALILAFLLTTRTASPMSSSTGTTHKRTIHQLSSAEEIPSDEQSTELAQKIQKHAPEEQQEKITQQKNLAEEKNSTDAEPATTTNLTLIMPSWTIFTEQESLGNLAQGLDVCGIQAITTEQKWPAVKPQDSLSAIREFIQNDKKSYERLFSHDKKELNDMLNSKKIPALEKITEELSKKITPLLHHSFSSESTQYHIIQKQVDNTQEKDFFSIAHELRVFGNADNITFPLLEKIDQASVNNNTKTVLDFSNPKFTCFYGFSHKPKTDCLEKMLCDLSQKVEHYMSERDSSFKPDEFDLKFNQCPSKVVLAETLISFVRGGFLYIGGTGALILTNDEIEFVLAHELIHWYRSHGQHAKALCDLSYGKQCSTICNCFSRAYEAEADIIALEITKKPLAAVTALLKSYRIFTLSIKNHPELSCVKDQVEDDCHPTYYDRIMYALQQHEAMQKTAIK